MRELHLNNIYFSLAHTRVVYCNQWAGKWLLRDILLKCALYGQRADPFVCVNASELQKEQHVGKLMESKAKEQQREKDPAADAELFFSINTLTETNKMETWPC